MPVCITILRTNEPAPELRRSHSTDVVVSIWGDGARGKRVGVHVARVTKLAAIWTEPLGGRETAQGKSHAFGDGRRDRLLAALAIIGLCGVADRDAKECRQQKERISHRGLSGSNGSDKSRARIMLQISKLGEIGHDTTAIIAECERFTYRNKAGPMAREPPKESMIAGR